MADKFGMPSDEKEAYAKAVVLADMDEPGVEDVMRKVMADIAERGVDVSDADVRAKIAEFDAVAVEQIANE